MTFRALDSNGDWTFGNGRQNYLVAEKAIQADIRTALWMFLGECFWATNVGVDWWNLIGGKNAIGIVTQTRQVIINRYGVAKINKVDSFLNRNTRKFHVNYNIDTIYSRNASGSIQVI